jgi:hypothetical protein
MAASRTSYQLVILTTLELLSINIRAASAAPTLRPPVSHLPSFIIAQQVSCAHRPLLALM